ncbi:MAG: membrane protein insertase YidC [Candidatus Marinimicrobia bacterium]|nr:membrane protein insertase YidC [Candidatus Neomarinimicrobiota bacterium]
MDRKTIIAFVVIGIIIILMPYYQKIFNPVDETAVVQQETTTAIQQEVPTQTPPPDYVRPQVSIETRDLNVNAKDVVIVNDKFAMRLSNLGGGTIREYELFAYSDKDGNRVRLLLPEADANLNIEYTNLYQDVSNLEYIAFDCPRLERLTDGDTLLIEGETTLSYSALPPDGIKIEKTFTFYPDRYDFRLDVALADYMQKMAGLRYSLNWKDGFALTEENVVDDIMYTGVFAMMGEELVKLESRKAKSGEGTTLNTDGQTNWLAFKSKYFTGFIAPIESKGIRSELMLTKDKDTRDFSAAIDMGLTKSNYQQDSYMIGLVPAEKKLLKSYGMDLDKTMNWGGPIIKPFSIGLHWLMAFLYGLIPNYGVVILLMSLIVKLITYPLTHKSYSSMKRMQLVQPKIKELQEKYKNNKEVLQQKTMALYKEEKVNPMGGCLPMLLQLPVLYGLFIIFRTAIELRGAPFMLWMKDLSAPDALFSFGANIPLLGTDFNILPILMTVLMVVQQKLSGTGAGGTDQQAQQQKMMQWLMPAMMFFLFYKFPSGLVLYYLTFNALTILQQKYVINKKVEKDFTATHPKVGVTVKSKKKK